MPGALLRKVPPPPVYHLYLWPLQSGLRALLRKVPRPSQSQLIFAPRDNTNTVHEHLFRNTVHKHLRPELHFEMWKAYIWGSPLKTHFAQIPSVETKLRSDPLEVLWMYYECMIYSTVTLGPRQKGYWEERICPYKISVYEHRSQTHKYVNTNANHRHSYTHTPAWQSFLTMLNFALLNMPGALLRKRGELECPDF